MKSIITTLAVLILTINHIQAQSTDILFSHLDHVREMKYLSVTCITQDELGYMWFGSSDGLLRYDGYEVKYYKNNPKDSLSLSDNSIKSIVSDHNGSIWVATQGGGLDQLVLKDERFVHYQNDPKNSSSISGNAIWSVIVAKDSSIWAGTWSNGLCHLDVKTGEFERYSENTKYPVLALHEDNEGIIWYGADGLNGYNPKTQSLVNYNSDNSSDENNISSNYIRSIKSDNTGNLWIATENGGLNYLQKSTQKFTHYYHNPDDINSLSSNVIYDVYQKDNQLWIANNAGLDILNTKTQQIIHHQHDPSKPASISNNQLRTIYEDNSGSIWIGNEGNKINKVLNTKKFITYNKETSTGLSHNLIRSLYEDPQQNIWVGTQGGGLNKINSADKSISYYSTTTTDITLSSNEVSAIYQDKKNGELWIGHWGNGIDRFNFSNGSKTHYNHSDSNQNSPPDDRIQLFYEDQFGAFWVGTENGLATFDRELNIWTSFGQGTTALNGHTIQGKAFTEGPDGTLWIGTWNGLNKVSPDRRTITSYRLPTDQSNGLTSEHVISLHLNATGLLYIGTFGGGLNIYDTVNDNFSSLSELDGLSNNTVFGILEDDMNNIWMSTNKGLSRYTPSDKTFRNYDASEGLQGNEFYWGSAIKNQDGSLMFGGVNGFNLFYPKEIKDNEVIPPVTISDFLIYNVPASIGKDSTLSQSIGYTRDIILNHKQAIFSFNFSSLNFNYPEKNQYAYILEGFEENWNLVGNKRTATYTNLDAGNYTFKVKGSNNDGIWNDKGVSVNIEIVPPIWKTWWFRLMVLLIFIGTATWLYKRRMSEIKAQKKKLEQKVQEATEKVSHQNEELQSQSARLRDAIEETNFVVQDAVESGNFKARLETENKTGAWKELGDSVNLLFATVERPFTEINKVVNHMAQGDLTQRYTDDAKGDIEILANNLNSAMANLSDLLREMRDKTTEIGSSTSEMLVTIEEMNGSTGEIASAIEEMSKGAQDQVSQVDESSNLIENIMSSSDDMGSQADSINSTAKMGVKKSINGLSLVQKVDDSMKNVMQSSEKTNASITTLTNRANDISGVLSIIKEIASQTNLLALNAAIEAAQAGDAGRGFSVVAEEIRKLAEDSKKSAGDIETLIMGVQKETFSTARLVSEMGESIKESETASTNSMAAFEEISKDYGETLKMSEQIVTATKQQNQDVKNVLNIISGVVVIAEETAAGTEETASSATQLSSGMENYTQKSQEVLEIVKSLQDKVDQFKL
ncbi:MAG: methyl-accepting chemotaxis protein [Reichenbachiella sp.]